jgi:hypothetical protein
VNAFALPVLLGGKAVYGAFLQPGQGYRILNTSGVATGNNPETIFMVTSGREGHFNARCCSDFGNAEADAKDHGPGTMEALYFGNSSSARWSRGTQKGPWVQVDMENGIWAGSQVPVNPQNTPITSDIVFAMVNGRSDGFSLKGGDGAAGLLTTLYDGPRPTGYQPMKKQGSIILGIGGDNSDGAIMVFLEGAMTAGVASAATDSAVHADVVAAGYALPG